MFRFHRLVCKPHENQLTLLITSLFRVFREGDGGGGLGEGGGGSKSPPSPVTQKALTLWPPFFVEEKINFPTLLQFKKILLVVSL